MFGRRTWRTKKPLGYHGYLLTSCLGLTVDNNHTTYLLLQRYYKNLISNKLLELN